MYPVSDAFLQAVQENTRKYYWTGKITTASGVVHKFDYQDIVKGSGYISKQCCGTTEIELGTVYAAEMGITLFSQIDRYTLEGAKVELFYHLQLADGSYEEVPMGIFEVSEANRHIKTLELRKYDSVSILQISSRHRFSSSFSDFITRYTAVSSTNLRTQIAEYYALETDDGLTMNLGVNPLLQFGLEETRKQLCENILHDLSAVSYVPFDSDTIGNPALDVGDILTFSGGQADESKQTCITAIQYKIGGKQSLKCVGKNPRLAQAKSKNDKNISGLLNQIEAGRIGIHTFTNASSFSVAGTDVKIISIEFAASEETHVQFFGEIVIDVSAEQTERTAAAKGTIVIPGSTQTGTDNGTVALEGAIDTESSETADTEIAMELPVIWQEDGKAEVYVTFELNDEEIRALHPQESWHSGKHTLMLYYPIEQIIADYTNTFNVYLRMAKGTGTIGTGECIASISGQSMAAAPAWDGKITMEETAPIFKIGGGFAARFFTETIHTETMELVQRSYTDKVAKRTGIGAFCRPIETTQEGL